MGLSACVILAEMVHEVIGYMSFPCVVEVSLFDIRGVSSDTQRVVA